MAIKLGQTLAELLEAIPDLGDAEINYVEEVEEGASRPTKKLRFKSPENIDIVASDEVYIHANTDGGSIILQTDDTQDEQLGLDLSGDGNGSFRLQRHDGCTEIMGTEEYLQLSHFIPTSEKEHKIRMDESGLNISSDDKVNLVGGQGYVYLDLTPEYAELYSEHNENGGVSSIVLSDGAININANNGTKFNGKVDFTNVTEILGLPSNSGITELTTQEVRITDLADGIYKWTYNGEKSLYYYGETSTNKSSLGIGDAIIIVYGTRQFSDGTNYIKYYALFVEGYENSNNSRTNSIFYGYSRKSNGQIQVREFLNIPTSTAMTLLGTQTVTGNKTFTGAVDFTNATVTGLPSSGGSSGGGELTAEAINSALDGQQLQVGGLGIQSDGIAFMAGNINEKHDEDMPYIRADSGMGGYLDVKSDGAYFNNTKLATVNDVGSGGIDTTADFLWEGDHEFGGVTTFTSKAYLLGGLSLDQSASIIYDNRKRELLIENNGDIVLEAADYTYLNGNTIVSNASIDDLRCTNSANFFVESNFEGDTTFSGNVDFSEATVTGLDIGGGLDLGDADISYDSENQILNITSPNLTFSSNENGAVLLQNPTGCGVRVGDYVSFFSNGESSYVDVNENSITFYTEHPETGNCANIELNDGSISYTADNSHIFNGNVDFSNATVTGLDIGGGGSSKSFAITQSDLTSSGSTFSLTSDCLTRLTEFASTIDNEIYFEWTFNSGKAYFAGTYEVNVYNGFHGFHLFSATSASEAKIMSLNLSNGTFSGNTSPLNSILYSGSSLAIIVGAISTGSSSGGSSTTNTDEMPSIRLVSNKIGNKDEPISEENPLTLTVETSGQLQVGDQLQVCKRKLYTYATDVEGVRTKRYKLRKYAEYVVTEEDIADNRNIFSITIGAGDQHTQIQDMLRSGTNGKAYPNYLRIRRTCADNPDNAKMSKLDVFTIYGKYSKDDQATDGSIRIS